MKLVLLLASFYICTITYIIECFSVTEPVNTGDKCEPKPILVLCL